MEQEKEIKNVQTRRVGSLTFGVTLVCYGILFLVHTFVPMIRYSYIFRCWPIVFILLGSEILVENHKCKTKEWKMVYDFPAVIMLGVMLLFAMIMAVLDFEMAYQMGYGAIRFF
ncbi:MAG: DUF5668 domain-containing protein [Lachnospiraceae bacterium]|nr:DUF5668 domain-containing protein [Lachnospiraceae bacterium]